MRRILWSIAGLTFFAIGAIGAVVPILPTVVFMLLAAYCFARGSQRLHGWLMTHRQFGPAIQDWTAALSASAAPAPPIRPTRE